MSWMQITCGQCGQASDFDDFTRTPVGGALPRNTFQCPACGYAFERRSTGQGTLFPSGLYVPGPVSLVPVDGRL